MNKIEKMQTVTSLWFVLLLIAFYRGSESEIYKSVSFSMAGVFIILLTKIESMKGIARTLNFKSVTKNGNYEKFSAALFYKYLLGGLLVVGGALKAILK